ncbi:MAG: M17 family peptidase N-terminal domain-containing protein, partial [Ktedonobacteraceae bacterium]
MQVSVQTGELKESSAKAIIVTVFEGANTPTGAAAEVDAALGGAISQLLQQGDVKGKRNETTLVHTLGRIPSPRVLVLGLGKSDAFNGQVLRNALAVGARYLRRVGAETVAVCADASLE